jgi:hypothetical protein
MSTKSYPDPNCLGPHKPRQRLVRWMHTKECIEAFVARNKPAEDVTLNLPEDATIVERGRAVGAL